MQYGAALKATVSRATFPVLFAMVSFSLEFRITSSAFAANECGAAAAVVNCAPSNYSPGGITYNVNADTTFNVQGPTTIYPTPGPVTNGIYILGTGTPALTVNLANNVTIGTIGAQSNGVNLYGNGNLSIISAANITVVAPAGTDPLDQSVGLLGWNPIAGTATGDINITQAANSTITATGPGGGGIYGLNYGSGSITLTSSGTIVTDGENGYGLNALNATLRGQQTTVRLTAPGNVITSGESATGLFSLNYSRTGNAFAYVDGTITAKGYAADGALAQINDGPSTDNHGVAQTILSNTANIHTTGDLGKGAWALNYGMGDAIVRSAGTVLTEGTSSFGLHARIANPDSTATASITLERGGTIVTGGTSAHGIFVNNRGIGFGGASIIMMESSTSVTTTGSLANGVYGLSGSLAGGGMTGGTVAFMQAAGASITVSGEQAFGVNLAGAESATADLHGTISASGKFGVGASSFSAAGPSEMTIAAGATVTGGWQADVAGLGATTHRPSAGVLLGSAMSSHLNNSGTIGAGSDRAIADIGRYQPAAGNLVVDNTGRVTGFVELAAGGTNVFNNNAGGLFDVRHFADINGDGVRDTKRVSISDFGAATSSFNNLSGATVRLAPVLGETSTDPTGYYIPTVGTDSRALEASYYTLGRSGVVQGQFTNLGTFHNAGVIDLRGSATGNTLVMTSNPTAGGAAGNGVFISDGGRLLLNSVLNAGVAPGGQTGSFSDVLVVDSTRLGTGATTITIDRRDGTGAATPGNGILLVEVRNKAAAASAPGVFTLNGDYIANGEQAVVKGAFAYNLFRNGVANDAADGNWYLRNGGLAPSVPVYEEYPKVIQPLINVPSLLQRVGNRYWYEPGLSAPQRAPQKVFCKDPEKNYQCVLTEEQASYYLNSDGTVTGVNNSFWGRVEGAYGRYQPAVSTSGAQYDSSLQKVQVGLDGLLADGERGRLIGGVTATYGHVSADITTANSRGNIRADGYGVGGTLTWYGTNGFYADAQAQATWFTSDLNSTTLERGLVNGNKGFGYALSGEIGQRITLNQHWTMTPQLQLIYLDTRFDSFTDRYGAAVSLSDGDSLRGRLGLAVEYQRRWKQADNTFSRVSAYGIANLTNEFLNGTRVDVSGTVLASRDDRLWGGLGMGGSYNWDNDRYAVFGQLLANTSLAHFGDSFEVGGTVGLRVRW